MLGRVRGSCDASMKVLAEGTWVASNGNGNGMKVPLEDDASKYDFLYISLQVKSINGGYYERLVKVISVEDLSGAEGVNLSEFYNHSGGGLVVKLQLFDSTHIGYGSNVSGNGSWGGIAIKKVIGIKL